MRKGMRPVTTEGIENESVEYPVDGERTQRALKCPKCGSRLRYRRLDAVEADITYQGYRNPVGPFNSGAWYSVDKPSQPKVFLHELFCPEYRCDYTFEVHGGRMVKWDKWDDGSFAIVDRRVQ